jgi:hypothetical protein
MKYCPHIFHNLYIEKRNQTEVNLALCCIAKISPNETIISQRTDWLNSERDYLLKTGELPESCKFCSDLEKRNVKSQRMKVLESNPHLAKYPDTNVSLKEIQYNCDNVCNLKCIICSGKFSSSWIEDQQKLKKFGYFFPANDGIDLSNKIKPTKHNKLAFNLDLELVKNIYFNGGEPLMSKDIVNFLDYVINNADPKKISIQFNTNATWPITDLLLYKLKKFSSVTILCSIDGIGERFEYIRFPGVWKKVEGNLHDFQETRFECLLTPTIGVHNILYIDELITWSQENNYKMNVPGNVFGHLSLDNFPIEVKENLLEYIYSLPNFDGKEIFINQALSITEPSLQWIDYLNKLDDIRGNSWRQSLSKLYHLLKTKNLV